MNRTRRMLGVLTVGGVLLLSASCGGDDGADANSGKPAGADPMASFRACLEKQGVTLPERGTGGAPPSGRPSGAPSGAPPSGRPSGAPSDRPDGAPSQRPSGAPSGRPSGAPTDRPTRSAAEQKAMQACASFAPQRGAGRGAEGGEPGPGGPQQGGAQGS